MRWARKRKKGRKQGSRKIGLFNPLKRKHVLALIPTLLFLLNINREGQVEFQACKD